MAMAFAISLSAMPEDLESVKSFYKPEMDKGFIFISKVDMTLTLVGSQGQVVASYPIACGENIGQKSIKGDHKTPEGYFLLQNIHESSKWGHDFHDGKGFIRNAYGPYFLRLQTGFQGIGIHGTHAPESIGTRATEGCIRLDNKNIADLEGRVSIGMPVIIGPEAGVDSLIACNAPSPVHPRLWRGRTNTPAVAPDVQQPERIVAPIAAAAPLTAEQLDLADPIVVPRVAPLVVDHLLTVVDGQLDINPETDLIEPVLAEKITEPLPVQPVPVLEDNADSVPVLSALILEDNAVQDSVLSAPVLEDNADQDLVLSTLVLEDNAVQDSVLSAPVLAEITELDPVSAVSIAEPTPQVDALLADNVPVASDNIPAASDSNSTTVSDGSAVEASPSTPAQPVATTASVAQPAQPVTNKHRRRRGPTYIKPDSTTVATPHTTPQYEVVVVEVTQPDGTVKYEVQYKPIK